MFVDESILQALGFATMAFVAGFLYLGFHLSRSYQRRIKVKSIRKQYAVKSNPIDLFQRPSRQ